MLRSPLVLAALLALTVPAAALEPPIDYSDFIPNPAVEALDTTGDTPPDAGLVARLFALAFAEPCGWAIGGSPEMQQPEIFELTFQFTPGEPESPLRLYRFFCNAGAYNEQHVYMTWDPYFGLHPVSFAQPTYTMQHETPDNPDTPVVAMQSTGYEATSVLVNSGFDPETRTIASHSCWRGICDASSRGIWVQEGAVFSLQQFAVDGSYDGEETPWKLVDLTVPVEIAAP